MKRKRWTDEKDTELKRLAQKYRAAEIAERLGRSVAGKSASAKSVAPYPTKALRGAVTDACVKALTANAQFWGCGLEDAAGRAEDQKTGLSCPARQEVACQSVSKPLQRIRS